jgi:DNA-binding CsgD family transcriptional regulator
MEHVISEIYKAGAGAVTWDDALGVVCSEADWLGGQMISINFATGSVQYSHAAGVPPEAELAYYRRYHAFDPRVPLAVQRPVGDWFFDEDDIPEPVAESNPFYQDLLIPVGGRYSAVTKLLEKDGQISAVGFLARRERGGFDAEQRALLARLSYHLREATALYERTRQVREAAAVGLQLIQRLNRPAMVLGAGGALVLSNDRAAQWMSGSSSIVEKGGVVTGSDEATDRLLRDALTRCFERVDNGAAEVVRLRPRSGQGVTTLSLTPFVPAASLFAFGGEKRVLLEAHSTEDSTNADLALWAATFDLTLAEAQVAALMAEGKSAEQIASQRQVSIGTVRTQIKALLEKTGSERQLEVVARLRAVS